MTRHFAALVLVAGGAITLSAHGAQQAPASAAAVSTRDIDRDVWTVLVDTVAKDDIVRMGATYTADAILVTPNGTQPIKTALERWGRDMVANKARGTTATVEFRFSRRLDNATTAFESGIFNYTTIDKDGVKKPGYFPFEELLVKIDGRWRIVMERQFAAVTEAEWNKLPRWP